MPFETPAPPPKARAFSPVCLTTAWTLAGQTLRQAPHLMQAAWSMMWAFFLSPLMAFTGQAFRQSRQPTHLSGSMS